MLRLAAPVLKSNAWNASLIRLGAAPVLKSNASLIRLGSTMASPFYALTAKDIKGNEFAFSDLQGKTVLVVNVASKCGFTPQYKGLQELYDKHKDEGFVIVGFPCDQFGHQEPGGEDQIESFCQRNFGVSFPMMSKVEVNGDNTHPVYQYLKHAKKQLFMERIKWNFEKFLVSPTGEVTERYSSAADPMKHIDADVTKMLAGTAVSK